MPHTSLSNPVPTQPRTVTDDRLTVHPWLDASLVGRGVDPRSEYVERFWLGVVGPSVVLLMRRLTRGFDLHPQGFAISVPDTARAIGLGAGTGRNSPMTRTLDRAALFGLVRRTEPAELHVRTLVPLLTPRQLSRLPLAVRSSHAEWVASSGASAA